jgi:hypothetical protein
MWSDHMLDVRHDCWEWKRENKGNRTCIQRCDKTWLKIQKKKKKKKTVRELHLVSQSTHTFIQTVTFRQATANLGSGNPSRDVPFHFHFPPMELRDTSRYSFHCGCTSTSSNTYRQRWRSQRWYFISNIFIVNFIRDALSFTLFLIGNCRRGDVANILAAIVGRKRTSPAKDNVSFLWRSDH